MCVRVRAGVGSMLLIIVCKIPFLDSRRACIHENERMDSYRQMRWSSPDSVGSLGVQARVPKRRSIRCQVDIPTQSAETPVLKLPDQSVENAFEEYIDLWKFRQLLQLYDGNQNIIDTRDYEHFMDEYDFNFIYNSEALIVPVSIITQSLVSLHFIESSLASKLCYDNVVMILGLAALEVWDSFEARLCVATDV